MSSSTAQSRAWLLGGLSTLLGAIGQLLFRRFGQAQQSSGWPQLEELGMPAGAGYLATGVCCYLIAVLLWVSVLRIVPLSRAYPLLSLSYPLVYLGAIVWLGELMSPLRTLGTALVTVGALLAVAPHSQPSPASR